MLAAEILKRGLNPLWPSSQTEPFDIGVASASRVYRVQVKASSSAQISAKRKLRGKEVAYTAKEIDFLAIYLAQQELFYLIPIKEIKGRKTLHFHPENPACPYAKYKEAWDQLSK